MQARLTQFACIGLICVAIFIAAYVIQVGSANVPFLDQFWCVAPTAISVADGVIPPLALFTWSNEHRIVFTMLTNILSVILTGWNTNFEVWVNLGLAVVVFGLTMLIVARFGYTSNPLWLGVPIAFVIFGARQGDNWMRGYSQFLYGAVFMLLALWFLMRLRVGWRGWWAVMLCAFAASWSFAGGLTLWGILLPALWLRGYRRWQYYAAWFPSAALCAALYFIGYQPTGLESSFAELTVFDYAANFLKYLARRLHLMMPWRSIRRLLLAVLAYCWQAGSFFTYGKDCQSTC